VGKNVLFNRKPQSGKVKLRHKVTVAGVGAVRVNITEEKPQNSFRQPERSYLGKQRGKKFYSIRMVAKDKRTKAGWKTEFDNSMRGFRQEDGKD